MSGGRRIVALLGVALLAIGGGAAAWWWRSARAAEAAGAPAAGSVAAREPDPRAVPADTAALAPAGVRVRVQVLNAGGVSGLGRRATLWLRELGYDVVDYNTTRDTSAVTRVQVSPATRAWGERIVRALGGVGRVEDAPQPLRYVDVVVLLGRDWTPPAEPLRP